MIRVLTQYPIMFFFDDQVYSMFSVHCPLLKQFKMVSCRADQPLPNRVLSQLTCTGRDSSSPHYMLPRLNFNSYDLWLPAFVCKCAEKAQARGHRYFGIEFWGKWCKLHCGSFWSSAAYRWVYTRGGVYLEGAYKTACKIFLEMHNREQCWSHWSSITRRLSLTLLYYHLNCRQGQVASIYIKMVWTIFDQRIESSL